MNPSFSTYQVRARDFAVYDEGIDKFLASATEEQLKQMCRLFYSALGLCNEAGEVAGKVKKLLRDKSGKMDEPSLLGISDEMGDTQWYLADLASNLRIDLGVVAEQNLRKLRARKEANTIKGEGDNR